MKSKGTLDGCLSDDFDVAEMRDGVQGPDEVVREWTTEYRFTARCVDENGFEFVDAAAVIGVHRTGAVSSLRVSAVSVTRGDETPAALTSEAARSELENRLRRDHPTASVRYIRRRTGFVLRPGVDEATLAPSEVFNYVLVFPGGISRQKVARVNLASGVVDLLGP